MEEQIKAMEEAMLALADHYDVVATENLPKIAKARVRMKLDITECPCDRGPESSRGCISAKCLREIRENGICHCTAFKRKDS